jgi:putative membrane protein
MNRITCFNTSAVAALVITLSAPAFAKSGYIGKLEAAQFKTTNEEAGMKVKAIKPTGTKLSEDDAELLKEVAMGGMMQLEISKVAVTMATSEDVKVLAMAEVDEQTVLGTKIKEIAMSGGVTLPAVPDEGTMKMIADLKEKKGLEFDKAYLKGSGIDGHKKLQSTMEKVRDKASDAALKTIAATALPLIEIHLHASQDEAKDMD